MGRMMFPRRPEKTLRRKKSNKFGAKRTVCSAGHPHPSGLEASVCETLILRQRAGDIRNLKWQSTVTLAFGIKWKVDWEFEQKFVERDCASSPNIVAWLQRFAEAKGAEDRGFKLKLRMWREGCGPAPLELWKGTAKRPTLVETIYPKKEEV
jgi:hypothetical protein